LRLKILFLIALASLASFGSQAHAEIYSCVDAKGRTITADRPITDCLDRSQRELSSFGLVKRQIGPSLTAQEQVQQDQKDKLVAEQRAREAESKRRDRTLLLHYPSRAAHDQQRAAALAQSEEAVQLAKKIIAELTLERKAMMRELETYAKDPSKAPQSIKLSLQDNKASILEHEKIIAEQEQEKKQIAKRFDDELVRLTQLWGPRSAP
jgi:hypothetical protein